MLNNSIEAAISDIFLQVDVASKTLLQMVYIVHSYVQFNHMMYDIITEYQPI